MRTGSRLAESRNARLLLVLPALVFLGFHLRTLDYDFVWTDQTEIVDGGIVVPPGELYRALVEPRIGDPATGRSWAYYRPLQVVAVSLIHAFAGETPRAYRLLSLLLGAATMSLFAALAWLWIGRPGPALFAALFAGLHPAGLEVYVWIAGLSASMVALLLLCSLGCATSWLRGEPGARGPLLVAGCIAFYVLALLSKESAVVVPALVLAFVCGEAVAGRPPAGRAIRVAGYEVSARGVALSGALAALALLHIGVVRPLVLGGSASVGAIGGSPITHWLTALSSWPLSLGWMLVPWESNASDVVTIVDRLLDVRPFSGGLLLAGSVAAWFLLARSGLRVAALGVAWIWIGFLPASNLLPTLHARAERHVFLSTFGLALVLAQLGPALLARLRAPRQLAPILAVVVLLVMGQRTWARAPDWRSTVSLFERDVAREPDYREGRYWLGAALLSQGRAAEAVEHLEILLTQIDGIPGRASYLRGDPRLLYCYALLRASDPARAERFVRGLERAHPRHAAAPSMQACLGSALEASRRDSAAIEVYARLAEAERPDPQIFVALARCSARLGRDQDARTWLDRIPMSHRRDPNLYYAIQQVRRSLQGRSPR